MRAVGGLAGGVVLFLLGWMAWASPAAASPADPTPRPFTQPDGTTFTGRLVGDEFASGVETTAGYTVLRSRSGAWTFADSTADGRLRTSGIEVGRSGRPPAGAELAPHLRDEPTAEAAAAEREELATEAATPPAVGTQRVLVLLVEFADRTLSTEPSYWHDLFFGADQSVADFYGEASYGALALEAAGESSGTADDGVVRVTLPRDHPSSASSAGVAPVVAAALQAAGASVDFRAFDAAGNGDGVLTPDELHLVAVVAGYEAATGCPDPSIWAHRGSMDVLGAPTVGGVRLAGGGGRGGYVAGGELQCPDGFADGPATLGVWVHELGHDLGLIDLYDVDGGSRGVDTWSTMGVHWLALPGEPAGTRPPLLDPFSRWQLGWVTPTPVTGPAQAVPLAASNAHAEVVQVLDNPGGVDVGFLGGRGSGEYFLVENREREGYDLAVAGCGALVWHVDESRASNADDAARRVDVVEAGGGESQTGRADAGDPYPGTTANPALTPSSSPSSRLNGGLPSGVALRAFSPTCGTTVSLDVDPGSAPVPPPPNDRLADATPIAFSGPSTRTVQGSSIGATRQPREPRHGGGTGNRSVWWRFTVPRSGVVTISSTTDFPSRVALYRGPNVGRLTRVRGPAFRVQRGVRYLIAVDGRSPGQSGAIQLTVTYR